tara:strand:+ start:121 stop:819 length:699 start_codon:yes stop_codon:yes gene_type:complete
LSEILLNAIELICSFDQDLYEIIFLSLKVSVLALILSIFLGLPISAFLTSSNFQGRKVLLVLFNSLMALPPVFVGLVLYILFSKSGPFGFFDILYTPSIMIIAQIILILPIIISVSAETLEHLSIEYEELLKIMNINFFIRIKVLLWEGRFMLVTCILTGLGRALSEVGAILVVGGNIIHVTRVMTTSIALETSRGNLSLALSLGIILIFIAIFLNSIALYIRFVAKKFSYD